MLYESHADRDAQQRIAEAYARSMGLICRMTPQELLLPWDAEFFRDDTLCVSLAEVKRRACRRFTYATYKVDCVKVNKLLEAADRRQVRCGFLVGFDDGIFKLGLTREWLMEHGQMSTIHRKNRSGEQPDPAWEWSNELWSPVDNANIVRNENQSGDCATPSIAGEIR